MCGEGDRLQTSGKMSNSGWPAPQDSSRLVRRIERWQAEELEPRPVASQNMLVRPGALAPAKKMIMRWYPSMGIYCRAVGS